MPNIPLPPLQARLQPANLISPIVKGTPTPLDVIQHQQLIDYMARAKEGVETMQQVFRSKQIAEESAARAQAAEYAKSRFAGYKKYAQYVDKQDWDEGTKAAALGLYGSMYGLSWSGSGGGSVETPGSLQTLVQEALRREIQGGTSPQDALKMVMEGFKGLLPQGSTPPNKQAPPDKQGPPKEAPKKDQGPADEGLEALKPVALLNDQNQGGLNTNLVAENQVNPSPNLVVSNPSESTDNTGGSSSDNSDLYMGAPLGAGSPRIARASFLTRPRLPVARFG